MNISNKFPKNAHYYLFLLYQTSTYLTLILLGFLFLKTSRKQTSTNEIWCRLGFMHRPSSYKLAFVLLVVFYTHIQGFMILKPDQVKYSLPACGGRIGELFWTFYMIFMIV